MKNSKIKKGDIVTIWEDRGLKYQIRYETVVETSGNKWITTKNERLRYDSTTLCSEYMGYHLFHGNKEECQKFLDEKKEVKEMVNEIVNYFERSVCYIDSDVIRKVYEIIKKS